MPVKTITKIKGGFYTRRVQAWETFHYIEISEGEKRTARHNDQFNGDRIHLTREEIAKLAKLYPVQVSDKTKREAARDMKAEMQGDAK